MSSIEIDYEFDGSLKINDVIENYFYSPSTKLYIFNHPLYVDDELLKLATDEGIKIDVSPEKWIINTKLKDFLKILSLRNSKALTLPEYFQVRDDAIKLNNYAMLKSLESNKFIEMLSTIFIHDKWQIHNPKFINSGKKIEDCVGVKTIVETPIGRYGWIEPEKIDPETGLPTEVEHIRNINDSTIKYWDTHTEIGKRGILMAVRGYVTSIGKISLDLGFPVDAISHKLTIRECKKTLPKNVLNKKIIQKARELLSSYYTELRNRIIYTNIPQWEEKLYDFIILYRNEIQEADDVASKVIKEDIRDLLGVIYLHHENNNNYEMCKKIQKISVEFSKTIVDKVSDEGLFDFIKNRKTILFNAIKNKERIVFVIGHKNPDTDTVISSIFEAFRQYIIDNQHIRFIPVIDGNDIPLEIIKLLGNEIKDKLILTTDKTYVNAVNNCNPEWIYVDHNIGKEQSKVKYIVDHHFPSKICLNQQIPRRIIFAGSTSGLVALKYYGLGIKIPEIMAKIFLGAALMDTENKNKQKMTKLDFLVMSQLKKNSNVLNETTFYRNLMKQLLLCYDPEILFKRDYKEDWSYFGFCVAKAIDLLGDEKQSIINNLKQLAIKNNEQKNYLLTLVKVVDYDENSETIRKERIYFIFKENLSLKFKNTIKKAIETIIKHESRKSVKLLISENYIEYWGVGTQLSRKKLAPVIDIIVEKFNEYFYSPSTKIYLKRDFLKVNEKIRKIAVNNSIELNLDNKDVLVGSPAKLKFIIQKLNIRCATPSEYFKAYFDALKVNDLKMLETLTSTKYLEVLNALIIKKQFMIVNPKIKLDSENKFYHENHNIEKVNIPKGEPGLIDLKDIDINTGLPITVQDPQQYGKKLWRYWSPESDCSWVIRSSIFAYDIPALDLKFDFNESLPKLAIRPILNKIKEPDIDIIEEESIIKIKIKEYN